MPDIPYGQYLDLVQLVTQTIKDESDGEDGVLTKRLRILCFQHHVDRARQDDEAYLDEEEKLIIGVIRYMIKVASTFKLSIVPRLIDGAGPNSECCQTFVRRKVGNDYSSTLQNSQSHSKYGKSDS
jgi:hypothetical protein